ncbi:MAG: holo-ACP synthase [Pseudomonadota bacterium]
MILGIGTDIVQIPRIERLIEKFSDRFLSRILSPEEKEVYNKKSCRAFVARRFAGKEAISKALGTGVGRPLRFVDISIINDSLGAPKVKIKNYKEDITIHVSLSDDYPIATAFAVVTSL